MPHLLITTMPIDAPGGSDRPVSFSDIRDRRIHILKLTNLNEAPLSRIELQIQFPEAILDITSGESPSYYKVQAAENWDRQPVTVSGDISDSEAVEPFASEERTGLWRVSVDSVASNGTIKIKFLTATGQEGGL